MPKGNMADAEGQVLSEVTYCYNVMANGGTSLSYVHR
jgi:hypothetical protein